MKGLLYGLIIIILTLILMISMPVFASDIVVNDNNYIYVSKEHLPLIDVRGIVVDDEGNIYCGNHFFNRIHVYDKNGNFNYCLKIDSSYGDFRMILDENNNLNVATVRNDKVFVFDKNGLLINEESNNDRAYFEYDLIGDENSFIDKQNILYKIKSPCFYTCITKTAANGKTTTVISISFLTWIFLKISPFIIFGTLFIFAVIYQFKKKRKT